MTDHTTRDQITRIPLTIVSTLDGARTDDVLVGVLAADLDALESRAAGLVVPAGLTAEKLRDLAEMVDSGYIADQDVVDEIREWADVLELRETP